QATATDGDGSVISSIQTTIVGTFRLRHFKVSYPKSNLDGLTYAVFFALDPGVTIDPSHESFEFKVTNTQGTIVDFSLTAGQPLASGNNQFSYRSTMPGLKRVILRNLAPSFYSLVLTAAKTSFPQITDPDVTVTLSFGTDMLNENLTLGSRHGGRTFIAFH